MYLPHCMRRNVVFKLDNCDAWEWGKNELGQKREGSPG